MADLFTEVFNWLPLAHLIDSKVLVRHISMLYITYIPRYITYIHTCIGIHVYLINAVRIYCLYIYIHMYLGKYIWLLTNVLLL